MKFFLNKTLLLKAGQMYKVFLGLNGFFVENMDFFLKRDRMGERMGRIRRISTEFWA